MDKIVAFCKRRGFVYQSSEIYGGIRSSYDYGPLGVELKRNIKDAWWRSMVHAREDVVGIDTAIIMHPRVWEASGHVGGFNDMLVESRTSGRRYRADHLIEEATGRDDVEGLSAEELDEIIQNDERVKDPADGGRDFAPVRPFNLMFETHTGPVRSPESAAYLRPETAQGIFVNFKNVLQTTRVKVPFGIAQVGKSFRNEITPGNFIFRTREFEQMEMEFFVEPGTDEDWHEYWLEQRWNWYMNLGLDPENLRFYEHPKDKLSHYSKRTVDIEYDFPFRGWSELEGVANRTDFDLRQHAQFSGENLEYFDQATNDRYYPYVIEPAAGPDRIMLAVLVDAYNEEEVNGEQRTVLKLHPLQKGARLHRRPRAIRRNQGRLPGVLRRVGRHRPPLPQAGRSRDPFLRDGGLRHPRRQAGHHPRPGLDGARARADVRGARATTKADLGIVRVRAARHGLARNAAWRIAWSPLGHR
jgi:glycyl-tRNA synthetase